MSEIGRRTFPRPWMVKRCDMNSTALKDANENLVVLPNGEGHEELADLIVKAVNCHDKLVEALKPFAAMDREGGRLSELAVMRGRGCEMTTLESRHFRVAAQALALVEETK